MIKKITNTISKSCPVSMVRKGKHASYTHHPPLIHRTPLHRQFDLMSVTLPRCGRGGGGQTNRDRIKPNPRFELETFSQRLKWR